MMTALEFRVALVELEMTHGDFATIVGRQRETVSRWARGRLPVPQIVEIVIGHMKAERKANAKHESAAE
jgi:hypothetical protein